MDRSEGSTRKDPIPLSATAQEYRGERYYRCGPYFQRKGKRLHRAVWEDANGTIPDGFHVHHRDHNRSNNALSNLALMEAKKHLQHHYEPRGISESARNAAAEWHRSESGREWHRKHYRENVAQMHKRKTTGTCQHCGSEYVVSAHIAPNRKFCGPNCKARALRKRRAEQRAGRVLHNCSECR